MKLRPSRLWLLLLPLSYAPSCTRYEVLNTPPPERVAELWPRDDLVRVSPGVALAIECRTFWGNPCAPDDIRAADTSIAVVHPAHLARIERFPDGRFTPTSFVVVGVNPGETTLTIPGEDPLRVVVVADR